MPNEASCDMLSFSNALPLRAEMRSLNAVRELGNPHADPDRGLAERVADEAFWTGVGCLALGATLFLTEVPLFYLPLATGTGSCTVFCCMPRMIDTSIDSSVLGPAQNRMT